eukprot:5769109-Amphidinium_carterae.1
MAVSNVWTPYLGHMRCNALAQFGFCVLTWSLKAVGCPERGRLRLQGPKPVCGTSEDLTKGADTTIRMLSESEKKVSLVKERPTERHGSV